MQQHIVHRTSQKFEFELKKQEKIASATKVLFEVHSYIFPATLFRKSDNLDLRGLSSSSSLSSLSETISKFPPPWLLFSFGVFSEPTPRDFSSNFEGARSGKVFSLSTGTRFSLSSLLFFSAVFDLSDNFWPVKRSFFRLPSLTLREIPETASDFSTSVSGCRTYIGERKRVTYSKKETRKLPTYLRHIFLPTYLRHMSADKFF